MYKKTAWPHIIKLTTGGETLDILLAFILYRQCSENSLSLPLYRILPFLPPGTQRGLAAIEAYNGDICTEPPDKEELFNALECSSIGKFPLLLARMLTMGNIDTSSPEGIFSVLKCLLPPEVPWSNRRWPPCCPS